MAEEIAQFKKIELVNDAGDLIMSLGSDADGKDAEIRMYSSTGHELVVLFARSEHDCGVSILSPSGQVKVSMSANRYQFGSVVYGRDGSPRHQFVVDELE